MSEPFLTDYQFKAVEKMKNGCILNGGVGSGKSRTGLYYYFTSCGGKIDTGLYSPMESPLPLYIITTALKRDNLDWVKELAYFNLSPSSDENVLNKFVEITIDSWHKIKSYCEVKNAFFIFDEDKVTGDGVWVKSFLKIAKSNKWIILSATPGDTWTDYIPVFLANGFYKSKWEFEHDHIVYSPYVKYRSVDRYLNTGRLIRLRNSILIDMEFDRPTKAHHEDIWCDYDIDTYKYVMKHRWDIYKDEPVQQVSSLCYVLRHIVNTDESRIDALVNILNTHPKAIIFYTFDYERELLLHFVSEFIHDDEALDVAEWSGHAHMPVPTSNQWIYLVQYTAGCEGWNCITTDTIIFYSQTYSYKVLEQACGRINRMNTPFVDLYYYHLKSRSSIDLAISRALARKKSFNEKKWVG